MYLWIGCKLPMEYETRLRQQCLLLNEQLRLDTTAFMLPQHISLKISFCTDQWADVLSYLEQYLSQQDPFAVEIQPPQQNGNILWLPVAENTVLQQLHRQLDSQLEERFGITQHEFDKCFLFHSTLFIDTDADKLSRMYKALLPLPIAGTMMVDTFLLGVSETGTPGSYRVLREIRV